MNYVPALSAIKINILRLQHNTRWRSAPTPHITSFTQRRLSSRHLPTASCSPTLDPVSRRSSPQNAAYRPATSCSGSSNDEEKKNEFPASSLLRTYKLRNKSSVVSRFRERSLSPRLPEVFRHFLPRAFSQFVRVSRCHGAYRYSARGSLEFRELFILALEWIWSCPVGVSWRM